jgi:hypothetical protein
MRFAKSAVAKAIGSITYATWNPSDKAIGVTLSVANHTAYSAAVNDPVRATVGKSIGSGKYVWEIRNGNVTGIMNSAPSMVTGNWPGGDLNSWGYHRSGAVYRNGSILFGGPAFIATDVITVLFDAGAGTLTWWLNGTPIGYTVTGITGGPYYPCSSMYDGGGYGYSTINAGDSAWAYTPTAGFVGLS